MNQYCPLCQSLLSNTKNDFFGDNKEFSCTKNDVITANQVIFNHYVIVYFFNGNCRQTFINEKYRIQLSEEFDGNYFTALDSLGIEIYCYRKKITNLLINKQIFEFTDNFLMMI